MVKRLVVCALAALGCNQGFEKPSIVKDLRILAVRADPAEVVVDFDPNDPGATVFPSVELTALIADPAVERRLDWQMTACPPTRSARCDDPNEPFIPCGHGTIADPETGSGLRHAAPLGAVGQLRMNPLLLEASVRADDLAGFGGIAVQVELWVKPEGAPIDQAIYASKQVVYAPRIPPGRVANQNPSLQELDADATAFAPGACGVDGTVALVVQPEQVVMLEPVEPAGARESYVLPTFDGGERRFTENLRYSWFATSGLFGKDLTGGPMDLFGNKPPLHTTWTAPGDVLGPVSLWVVQRDERGGTNWQAHCFDVENPDQ